MNNRMYEHPATQANLELLQLARRPDRGPRPGRGSRRRASGEWAGSPSRRRSSRWSRSRARYTPRSLDGLRVLVTAGGTREPIDSVRFIGNRSSGRMGLALAGGGGPARRRGDPRRGQRDASAAGGRRPRSGRDDRRARGRGSPALPFVGRPDHGRRARGLPRGEPGRRKALQGRRRGARARARVDPGHRCRRRGRAQGGPDAWSASRPSTARGRSSAAARSCPQGSRRRGGQRHLADGHRLRQRRQRGDDRAGRRRARGRPAPEAEVAAAILDEVERFRTRGADYR